MLEHGRGGHHLEARAGGAGLVVGARDEGGARLGQVGVPGQVLNLGVLGHQRVGIERGVRVHGLDVTVGRVVDHRRRPVDPLGRPLVEGLGHLQLQVLVHGQGDVVHLGAVGEQVPEGLGRRRVRGQVAVVLRLDAPEVAVATGVEPDDLGEEGGGVRVVDPLVLVDASRWGQHRRGQHRPVRREDAAPGLAACRLLDTRVLRVVGQRVGLEHLDVVELDEQGQEAEDHEHPESANPLLHHAPFVVVVVVAGTVVDGAVEVAFGLARLVWSLTRVLM